MHLPLTTALAALSLLAPAALSAPQQTASPGWQAELLSAPGGTYTVLANGNLVSFDGQLVELLAPDGTPIQQLADLGSFVFGSILLVDPSETFVVLGESSVGNIYRVPLDGSGETFVSNVFFNYDAEFSPSGELYISAATGGFSTGNKILTLDVDTGTETVIADLDGPSGPLTFDGLGNLYYATQTDTFPAPPGSTSVLLWTADQLALGQVLDEGDAFVFASGFDGASTMVASRETNVVYLAETNFGNGVARIRLAAGGPATSPILVEAAAFQWIRIQALEEPSSPEAFLAYQPIEGGRLVYNSTDFGSIDEQFSLRPRRPHLSFSGPGTSGPGQASLSVDGLPPNGSALFSFGPTSLAGSEVPLGGAIPLFVGLDLGTLGLLPPALPASTNGELSLSFFNPGGLEGSTSFQALVFDGPTIVGTTNVAGF